MAIKGFISYSFRDYQQENKIKISKITTMKPAERIKVVGRLFELLTIRFKKVLKNKTDEEKIDAAIKKAFNYYKKNFANR